MGVDLGAEVEALHRDHDRLGQHVAEVGVAQAARRRRGWSGSRRRGGWRASGCGAGAPRSWGASAGRRGRCGRRSRAAPGRRSARRPRTRCRGWRRRRSTSRRRTRRGWSRRPGPGRRTGRRRCGWRTRPGRSPRRAAAQRGVVRKAWTPVATSRPSTRWARSCRIASDASAYSSGRLCPRPTSMTTILPPRWGPASRIRSWARSALGAPPLTIGLSRVSALRVAGPQVPSGGMPKLRWNSRTPALGLRTEVAVDPADLEAEVEQPALQGVDVVAGHQVAGQVGQDPVAEPPAGLVEATEGQRADDAVDGQAALLLEGAYGELDALVVHRARRLSGSTGLVSRRPEDRSARADR